MEELLKLFSNITTDELIKYIKVGSCVAIKYTATESRSSLNYKRVRKIKWLVNNLVKAFMFIFTNTLMIQTKALFKTKELFDFV